MPRTREIAVLDEDCRALAAREDHLDLARAVARRYAWRRPNLGDEFLSWAYAGLCDAATTYDAGGGTNFAPHARVRIEGAILDGLRKARRRPPVLSLDVPMPGGDTLGDLVASGDEPVGWEAEYHDELRALSLHAGAGLRGRSIRLVYGRADCRTLRAAGRAMGFTESRAAFLHGEAIANLKGHFAPGSPGSTPHAD